MKTIPISTWFLMIPILTIHLSTDLRFLVSGLCHSSQQSLLVQFYNNLTFNQSKSTKLVSWDSSADCCGWAGVTCDEGGQGHVTGLNLSEESISGGIEDSSPLFSLQYLQNLDLSYNNFNTSMPPRFANLTSLVSLNLSNAGFWGQIPVAISRMTALVALDLTSSGLYFRRGSLKLENPDLAKLVQNLRNLRELYLDGVNISANGSMWCRALSSALPNLQVLSLCDCFLSGPIDVSLGDLQSLEVIRLTGNDLSTSVPDFFANFLNLTALQLGFCNLKGTFPESIFSLSKLEILDLSLNEDLQGYLPDGLRNAALKTLVLSNTAFSGSVPESIGTLPELLYLDISRNMFTGTIPSFGNSKKLVYIDLSHNNLSGVISNSHWESLSGLVRIDLTNNSLSGSIPSSLFAIQSLQKILLSSNQFAGQMPNLSNVSSSSSLDTLDLSNNNLDGPIPPSVFQLRRLNVLSLACNKFNGTIKLDWFQKLTELTTLDLSYNNLTVDANATSSTSSFFPWLATLKLASCNLRVFPDLRNQSNLLSLDLSDNRIAGSVPQWIGQVGNGSLANLNLSWNLLVSLPEPLSLPSSLAILDLHNNQLQGNIPTPPPSVLILDYSNNNFSSAIPYNFGECLTFAIFFSLSNNSVKGYIPESLCHATFLEVLDLSNNNLEGSIPSCLIERSKSLGVLNLRKNKFSGSIPDNFPEKCQLKTLDLSRNLLQGKVPRSLINCTILEVLDLGSNKISDTFPCLLRNISSLRILVLRNNKFYGKLCRSLSPTINPTWTRLQIIDIASNNFSGVVPNSILKSWKAMMRDGNGMRDHLKFRVINGLYYQDSVTVTSKGLQLQLVKILTIFTSIDFSCNKFEGPIPERLGQFNALFTLNLSYNDLVGQIPPSLGNLSQLESLDLSSNKLSGEIPQQLAGLTFISVLNLSDNMLSGRIPTSTQLQTFSVDSFERNTGLCGLPLPTPCSTTAPIPSESGYVKKNPGISWNYLSVELGYIFGLGIAVGPLIWWKRWSIWYYKQVDHVLVRIFPQLEDRIMNRKRRRRRRRT